VSSASLPARVFNGSESPNIDINNVGMAGESCRNSHRRGGSQMAAFIAGIQGVSTRVNDAVPVLIDSNGQLGTLSSSRRHKQDIRDMGDASDGLLRLRPVTYRYKKPYADGSEPIQYGLVAEEVAEVYPDLVVRGKDDQMETGAVLQAGCNAPERSAETCQDACCRSGRAARSSVFTANEVCLIFALCFVRSIRPNRA
jgi:endosialidase-like protein